MENKQEKKSQIFTKNKKIQIPEEVVKKIEVAINGESYFIGISYKTKDKKNDLKHCWKTENFNKNSIEDVISNFMLKIGKREQDKIIKTKEKECVCLELRQKIDEAIENGNYLFVIYCIHQKKELYYYINDNYPIEDIGNTLDHQLNDFYKKHNIEISTWR